MWSISAVARVVTDAGDLWLKAPCEHFRAEARVHPTVAGLFPDLVPTLVAVEETEGWLLMEPMTGADDADRADGAELEVVRRWAAAQLGRSPTSTTSSRAAARAGVSRRPWPGSTGSSPGASSSPC